MEQASPQNLIKSQSFSCKMAAQMTPRDGPATFNINELLAVGPGVQRMAVALLIAWLVGIIRLSALWPVLVSSWAIWLMADRHFKQKLTAERQQFLLTQTDLHPQTPEESVEWLNRLAALLWRQWLEPYFAVKLSKQLASKLLKQQSKYVEDAQLQSFTLGSAAPVFSNAQMLKHKGDVVMEMDVEFRSRDMQVTFGLKPNLNSIGMGKTTVRVSDCLLVGRLRFRPCSEEQVVLASFVCKPTLSLSINVSGVILTSVPLINHWLEGTVRAAMIKKMIEPYRLAMELPAIFGRVGPSLYDEHHKHPPERGSISIWLHGATLHSRSSSSPIIVQIKSGKCKRSGNMNPTLNPLTVVGNAKEAHQVPTLDRSGSVLFTVLEQHKDRKSSMQAERLIVVGTAFFQFKWMRDGRTCFWHNSTKHKPVLRKTDGVLPMRIAITTNDGGTEVGALDIEVQPSWLNLKAPSIKLATVHSADSVVETIMAAREGYWLVTLLEGRGLIPKDMNGKSDPYVQLQVGSTKRVSRVQRGTLHPVWNQLFTFAKGDKLSLLAFDHDLMRDDDFLGMAELDLFKYRDFQVHDLWVPLQGVASGEIHIRLAFERQHVDDSVVDEAKAAVQSDAAPNVRSRRPLELQLDMIQEQLTVFNGDQSSPGYSEDSLSEYSLTGNSLPTPSSSTHPILRESVEEEPVKANGLEGFLLTATLIKARHLHKGHLSLFTGKIDAYCKLICGGTTFKTSVQHNSADPEWGETFAFHLSAHPSRWHRHQHDSVLLIVCKDKSYLGRAGLTLGHCVVPLTKLVINKLVEEWLPLDGHRHRGELLLRLELHEAQAAGVSITSPGNRTTGS
eukprot:jgi/Chlat1/7432/Chrsp6S07442